MAENEKRRLSQLEEQLSNTLRAVDSLHADVATFKEYAVENNKMVNSMLNEMSERSELLVKMNERIEANQNNIEVLMTEMIAERKQRNLEIDTINRRLDRLENQ